MKTPLTDLAMLVAIPSFSGQENDAADFIAGKLAENNLTFKRAGNNIWSECIDFDPAKPTILLNSHLDTVKICDGWTVPPQTFTKAGDKCVGLGINDAGASLIGLLHVFTGENLKRLEGCKSAVNLIFLASAEEENSGKNGMEMMIPLLGNISAAIVGEPTGGKIAIAEKGLLVIDAVSYGEAGHAARNTGKNAIAIALEEIRKINEHQFTRVSETLGKVNAQVTIIQAGTQHNVIPASCNFTIDIRLNECYTHQEMLDELKTFCTAELTPRSMRLSASSVNNSHFLGRAAEKSGFECFCSPTMSDQALMPWPSLKFGIGESERSHTADEFIYENELYEGIKNYHHLLKVIEDEVMG